MSALERAISAPIEARSDVTDLPSVISEKNEKARQLAKGLLEIACTIHSISVADYINDFSVRLEKRRDIRETAWKLNEELGSPIPLDMFRSTFMWPPPPIQEYIDPTPASNRRRRFIEGSESA